MGDTRVTPEMVPRAVLWLLVEAAVLLGLAVVLTLVVANTLFYYGPEADPPGMTELGYALMASAIVVAGWRCVRRLRRYSGRPHDRAGATLGR